MPADEDVSRHTAKQVQTNLYFDDCILCCLSIDFLVQCGLFLAHTICVLSDRRGID